MYASLHLSVKIQQIRTHWYLFIFLQADAVVSNDIAQ